MTKATCEVCGSKDKEIDYIENQCKHWRDECEKLRNQRDEFKHKLYGSVCLHCKEMAKERDQLKAENDKMRLFLNPMTDESIRLKNECEKLRQENERLHAERD